MCGYTYFCPTFLVVSTLAFSSYLSECGCTCFSSTALCASSLMFFVCYCLTCLCASILAFLSYFYLCEYTGDCILLFVYAKTLAFLSYPSVCDYTGVFVP